MEHLRVVLVRPKYARNVGMVARAMANYGLKHLILIEPQCSIDDEAREGAANAQEVLKNAIIYPHWQRFYDWEHEGIRIAFSARDGKHRESFDFAASLADDELFVGELRSKAAYFIFGPEDHGLATDDLDFVHRVCQIALPGTNTSLNLSHAVLTALTLVYPYLRAAKEVPSEKESFFFPDQTLKKWLETLHIDLEEHQRINAYTVLRKLVLKSFPTHKELRVLETVLQQSIRKLTGKSKPSEEGEHSVN